MLSDELINRILGIVGTASGLIATAVSLYTLRYQLLSDKVSLQVSSYNVLPVSRDGSDFPPTISIEVVNLSKFPVRVTNIGIENHDRSTCIFFDALIQPQGQLPCTVNPRESVTLYVDSSSCLEPRLNAAKTVFAATACGLKFRERRSAIMKRIESVRAFYRG